MESSALSARFHAAHGMSIALGQLAMGYFTNRGSLGISMKGDQDWLTKADGEVEAAFRMMIAAAFPEDSVMGEEAGGDDAENLWIIDPIDGTANFAHGDPLWCVSIGFVHQGVPQLGVIHAPAMGETYLAQLGKGATLNGVPIKVASTTDIRSASLEVGWSTRRQTSAYLGLVERLFAKGASVKRGASGAMGLAYVAAGRTDAYLEAHINSWDVAAGLVIAREAGAVLNDFCSGNWLMEGNAILCVAPGLADITARESGIALPK